MFAPHFAASMDSSLNRATPLRAERDADSTVLAELSAGEPFELLDLTNDAAWGRAPGPELVGWLDPTALDVAG